MTIKANQLTAEELAKIEEEWNDSNCVNQLLGHIYYLNDALVALAGNPQKDLVLKG